MKHVFIINPNSGKSELKEELINDIKNHDGKIDYEIYITKNSKDATSYVKEYLKHHTDDVTFYACGGDGTINEVASGMVGYTNAILACYPCGSGNDFVKVYGGKEAFLNLDNLINGKEEKIDIMKVNDMYSINVTNFGFEASVCNIANNVRRKKIIGGKHSYTTGIIASLFTSRKTKCKILVNEEEIISKNILLATVANGQYVGGAYKCAPYSNNKDGLLELCIVKPITLLKFISLINPYKKGEHLNMPKLKNKIIYKQVEALTILANDNFKICLDGEIYTGNKFEIRNMRQAIRFIVPKQKGDNNE